MLSPCFQDHYISLSRSIGMVLFQDFLFCRNFWIRPNKKISVFRVMCLKSFCRVDPHNFFSGKIILNKILCVLKGNWPFKMH